MLLSRCLCRDVSFIVQPPVGTKKVDMFIDHVAQLLLVESMLSVVGRENFYGEAPGRQPPQRPRVAPVAAETPDDAANITDLATSFATEMTLQPSAFSATGLQRLASATASKSA